MGGPAPTTAITGDRSLSVRHLSGNTWDQEFESPLLQQRVCKPSVPLGNRIGSCLDSAVPSTNPVQASRTLDPAPPSVERYPGDAGAFGQQLLLHSAVGRDRVRRSRALIIEIPAARSRQLVLARGEPHLRYTTLMDPRARRGG